MSQRNRLRAHLDMIHRGSSFAGEFLGELRRCPFQVGGLDHEWRREPDGALVRVQFRAVRIALDP